MFGIEIEYLIEDEAHNVRRVSNQYKGGTYSEIGYDGWNYIGEIRVPPVPSSQLREKLNRLFIELRRIIYPTYNVNIVPAIEQDAMYRTGIHIHIPYVDWLKTGEYEKVHYSNYLPYMIEFLTLPTRLWFIEEEYERLQRWGYVSIRKKKWGYEYRNLSSVYVNNIDAFEELIRLLEWNVNNLHNVSFRNFFLPLEDYNQFERVVLKTRWKDTIYKNYRGYKRIDKFIDSHSAFYSGGYRYVRWEQFGLKNNPLVYQGKRIGHIYTMLDGEIKVDYWHRGTLSIGFSSSKGYHLRKYFNSDKSFLRLYTIRPYTGIDMYINRRIPMGELQIDPSMFRTEPL